MLGRAVQPPAYPPSREALPTSLSHSGALEGGDAIPEVMDREGKKKRTKSLLFEQRSLSAPYISLR